MPGPKLAPDALVCDRYRVVRLIGQGGMGAVYEAVDQRLGHRVALKQMLVEGDVADRAFEREARLLAGLRHQALPVVSDYFSEECGRFLVMQFIPGQSLAELAKERGGPFPVDQVLRWADQLLDALEYLHGQTPPVLHRDIKPANLKLTGDDEIVLLDFGLAKGLADGGQTGPTVYGLTPQFAPLEQFYGSGTDARSDLFALGATLYFLLGCTVPVGAPVRVSSVDQNQPDPLQPLSELNPEVSPRLGAWIARALAVHQHDRPPSAAAMRRELAAMRGSTAEPAATLPLAAQATRKLPTAVPDGPIAVPQSSGVPPAVPHRRSRWRLSWIAGAAVVAMLPIAGWMLGFGGSGSPPPAESVDGAPVQVSYVEGEGIEFRWPAEDHWTLSQEDKRIAVVAGSSRQVVPPGRYRIEPTTFAVFEPLDVDVRAGQATVVAPPSGTFEFRWPGEDHWKLSRGKTQVAVLTGTAGRVVAPGRYRIEPTPVAAFDPVEFDVQAGRATVVAPPSGTFEFRWPGEDHWKLSRGKTQVAVLTGTTGRVVAPGRYRVEPSNIAVFEPVEFDVLPGRETIVEPPAGSFEFVWSGTEFWKIQRGTKQVAVLSGTAGLVVSPGRYRIEPVSGSPFPPVDFTVSPGSKTVVTPPALATRP